MFKIEQTRALGRLKNAARIRSTLSFRPSEEKGRSRMKEHDEEWKNLCEQAAFEKDPQKLLALTKKINDLLLGKQHRLNGETSIDKAKGSGA
jgi:hypothetical protein